MARVLGLGRIKHSVESDRMSGFSLGFGHIFRAKD